VCKEAKAFANFAKDFDTAKRAEECLAKSILLRENPDGRISQTSENITYLGGTSFSN